MATFETYIKVITFQFPMNNMHIILCQSQQSMVGFKSSHILHSPFDIKSPTLYLCQIHQNLQYLKEKEMDPGEYPDPLSLMLFYNKELS